MVLGRARVAGGGALAALILAVVAGCGAETPSQRTPPRGRHPGQRDDRQRRHRRQPPVIGVGPEKSQQLPQNQNHPQPPIKTQAPMDVVFVTANQTGKDSKLLIRGPSRSPHPRSTPTARPPMPPTADRQVHDRRRRPKGAPATLKVGPYRASSKNDLLLP